FFQAEDAIRYLIVTGVQTCALPIFSPADSLEYEMRHGLGALPPWDSAILFYQRRLLRWAVENEETASSPGWWSEQTVFTFGGQRSEERRVGKERRPGWGPACVGRKG